MDALGAAALAPAAAPEPVPRRVRVVHDAVPGRARLHLNGLYGAPPLAAAVERDMAGMVGVSAVAASPRTGNVLVLFDPALPLAQVMARLANVCAHNAAAQEPQSAWSAQDAAGVAAALGSSTTEGLRG